MKNIEEHIANLASLTNKAISRYARLDMCKFKNILVTDEGRVVYIEPPERLEAELKSEKHKIDVLFNEIADAIKERDGITEEKEVKGDSFFEEK